MTGIEIGLSAALSFEVSEDDTALALGSGDVPVLATPQVVAWLEAATVEALAPALEPGRTTVGTRIDLEHTAATAVGATVIARAAVSHVDDRLVRFEVALEQETPEGGVRVVASGRITRVVVDRERFLARIR